MAGEGVGEVCDRGLGGPLVTALSESFTPLLGWLAPPFPPHHTPPQPTPPSPLGILGVGLDSVTIFKFEMCLKKVFSNLKLKVKGPSTMNLLGSRDSFCVCTSAQSIYGMSSLLPPAGEYFENIGPSL